MRNSDITKYDVQSFINKSINSDINKIILAGSPFPEIDIKDLANQIEAKKKSEKKLPTWFRTDKIIFPNKLSIEQTSSEKTAEFKASLFSGESAIDLTGGFGVDSFYFSKTFKNFTHCELQKYLSDTVKYNFELLKVKNVNFLCGDSIEFIKSELTYYDLIYLDPARRDDLKRKVFLLSDTQPNPIKHLENLLNKTDNILIKASPLLDIKRTLEELRYISSIYIISLNNEVKELLIHIEKNYTTETTIKCIDLYNNKENKESEFLVSDSNISVNYSTPQKYLYEPSAAILKAGAFNQVAKKYNISKIAKHSHIYTSDLLVEGFQGRIFEVYNTSSVNKKEIKRILNSDKANITKRNFTASISEIRKKFKIKEGGDDYLFFTTSYLDKPLIIYCRKILQTT